MLKVFVKTRWKF